MFIMILTGRVARENWDPLTALYDKTVSKKPPKGLLKSFLVQSEDDPPRWKIVMVWDTKADYKEYSSNNPTDAYVELMCDGGTAPYSHGYVVKTAYERV